MYRRNRVLFATTFTIALQLLCVTFLAGQLFAAQLSAADQTRIKNDPTLRSIIERVRRGESITVEEKNLARPYLMEMARNRVPQRVTPPLPPSIDELDTVGLPYTQNFSGTFPPTEWTTYSTGGTASPWAQFSGSTPTWAYVPYYTVDSPGEHDYMLTPVFNFSAVNAAEFDFNWAYGTYASYNDTLYVAYTLDNGTTYNIITSQWGNAPTGPHALLAPGNETGIGTTPPTTGFGFAQIPIPAGALGHPAVRFAFIGVNEFGNHLFITNVHVFSLLGQAANPIPPNLSANVATNSSLQWTAGTNAVGYNVKFGTDSTTFPQVITNQNVLTYTPTLAASTTYYWQVIALGDTAGLGTSPGPIWRFTTGTGTAPLAPSNGAISSSPPPSTSSIAITWNDNSNNETGFPIYEMSSSDTAFSYVATAPANATSYTITGLNPNTHYAFRVYAANASATSLNFATANTWTLANVPGMPAQVSTGISAVTIGLNNGGNPANTEFAIYETTTSQYLQTNGTLGASIAWATAGTWGASTNVTGLSPSTAYHFEAKARNGMSIETIYSAFLAISTTGAYSLPVTQDFSGATFPPADWTIVNPDNGITWDRVAGTPNWAHINFWAYGSRGQLDYLITPPITTLGLTIAEFDFNWSYASGYVGSYDDGLELAYSVDNGTTWNQMWYATANDSLIAGTGATITSPATSNFGFAQVPLPAGALNQASVKFALIGHNDYGPDIYVTNLHLFYLLGPASNPIPADQATNVATNSMLQWTAGGGANAYNVAFGTVNPPTTTVSLHQTGLSYTPTLTASTTYYWRVTSLLDTAGVTTNSGPVWSFTTGAGASPNAPTNGIIDPVTDATPTSLHLHWTSNSSGNESRFLIYRSTDSTTFTRYDSVASGVVQYTNTGLSPNTPYWYRVYSFGNGVPSTQFASANGFTLANTPGSPPLSGAAVHSMQMTFGTAVPNGNPSSTVYAIHLANTSQYIQANGNPDTGAVWRTITQWGDPLAIHALLSSTLYTVEVKARNGAGVTTAFGPSDTISTNAGLVGIKTIGGTNPDFATIQAAIDAANQGVGSPGVTFMIRGGTYNENPDSITAAALTGPASYIVFKPADTLGVTINVTGTSTSPFGYKFFNASYVTFDGSSSALPGRRLITVNATGTYGYYGFWYSNGSSYDCVKNCVVTVGGTTSGNYIPIRGYYTSTTDAACNSDSVINNRLVGGYYGIYLYGYYPSPPNAWNNWYIAKNQIVDCYYYGLLVYYVANSTFRGNEIYRTTQAASSQYGIYSTVTQNSNDVFDANWIHDITPSNTGSAYAMYITAGTNTLISNNMIDLTFAGIGSYLYGIYVGSNQTNIINNTIHIGGSSGSTGSSYALAIGSTVTQDTLANNILINDRTGNTAPTYYNVCFYQSGAHTATSFNYSNHNIITTVDETTTDNRVAAWFTGTNVYNTLTDLQQLAGYSWDANSLPIPPQFVGAPNLHINPSSPTPVESGAIPFASVPRDFDNDLRSTTTPDIGCDEGNFLTAGDLYPPNVTGTPLATWQSTTARPFSVTITDNVEIAGAPNQPRVWFRRAQDTTYSFNIADSSRDSTYYFHITGFPLGTLVYYYVAAQDTSLNVRTWPTGGSGSNPPGTIPPPNAGYYFVAQMLAGVKSIGGTNPDYTTLHDAILAINNVGVTTGGVTFKFRNGTYNEQTATLNAPLDITTPVKFAVDSGATATINFTIAGGNSAGLNIRTRYITVDGSWPGDISGKHINITGTNLVSAVWFSDSSSYNTIKNCVLDIGIQTAISYVVRIGNPGVAPEIPIIGNQVLHCDLNGGYYGLYHYGNTTEHIDSSLISYCNIMNFYSMGLYLGYGSGNMVTHNHIYHTTASTNFTVYGSYNYYENNILFDANQIGPLLPTATGSVYGVYNYYSSGSVYSNNMISLGSGNTGTVEGYYSYVGTGSAGNKLLFNSINITGTTTGSNSMGYYISYASAGLMDTLWGNIIQNIRTGGATGTIYHVCLYVPTLSYVAFSNYNLLWCGGEGTTDNNYIARLVNTNYNAFSDLTGATSTWTYDQFSYSESIPFIADSNLHIDPTISTVIESGAPHHWQVTTDFDAQARVNAAADIGADEGTFRTVGFGTLHGTVRDSVTSMAPLPGVTVTAGRYTTTTDDSGHFSIDVRTGIYTIIFSMDCYTTDSISAVNVDSAQSVTENFWMYHPEISTDHTSIDILSQPGEMHSTTLTITNPGNSDMHWTGAAISNPHTFDKWNGHSNANSGIHLSVVDGANMVSHNGTVKIPLKGSMDATSGTMMVKAVVTPSKSKQSNMTDAAPGSVALKGTTASGGVNPRTNSIDELDTSSVISEDFSGATFPPAGWTIVNPDNSDTWQQYSGTGGAPSWAYIDFWGYDSPGQLDYLITPAIDMTSVSAGVVQFNWSYASGYVGTYDDGLELSYSTDNGSTWNRLWYATANDSLVAGTGATTVAPATSNFGFAQVILPAATLGQSNIKFALIGHDDYGPNIFVTNFVVASTTPPFLTMSPTSGTVPARQAAELFIQATIDTNVTIPVTWTGVINLTSDACPHLVSIPVTVTIDSIAAVKQDAVIPYQYKLYQNYPNPFNPSTEIRFDLKQAGMTRLTIFDVTGRQVAELVNRQLPAGFHSIHFEGTRLATGVYFYRIQSGRFTDTKKMILVK